MIDNTYKMKIAEEWPETFPSSLSGLFAFYECLCTLAIIGCEIGSILIDLYNATIYVGLWASVFFMVAWITQILSASCRRTYHCAKVTLITQCIGLVFAACVIGFDAYFIIYPDACFFPSTLCNSTAPIRGLFYSEDEFNNIKILLIKGQLAIATLMFAFCIDYIIMFVATHIRLKNKIQALSRISTITNARNTLVSVNNENNPINNVSSITEKNISTSISTTFEHPSIQLSRHSRWSMDSIELNPVKI